MRSADKSASMPPIDDFTKTIMHASKYDYFTNPQPRNGIRFNIYTSVVSGIYDFIIPMIFAR